MIQLLLNYFKICAYFPGFHVPIKAKFYDIRQKFQSIYWNDVLKAANSLAISRIWKGDNWAEYSAVARATEVGGTSRKWGGGTKINLTFAHKH